MRPKSKRSRASACGPRSSHPHCLKQVRHSPSSTVYPASSLQPLSAATRIASALLTAQAPLIVTSFLGRNPHAVPPLLALSTLLAIPIVVTCPSAVSVPSSHPYFAGYTYMFPGSHCEQLKTADVILIIDCDLPWIPANDLPQKSARVFVVDSGDPLKLTVGFWHVDAELLCCANSELALGQIVEAARTVDEQAGSVGEGVLGSQLVQDRAKFLANNHQEWLRSLDAAEDAYPAIPNVERAGGPTTSITVPNVLGVLRRAINAITPNYGANTLILNETISNYLAVWSHLRSDVPGSVLTSGGSSLGWGLGAAVGAYIGGQIAGKGKGYDLVVLVVGDGSYLFGVPSSAYWMARKYNTVCDETSCCQPFLTCTRLLAAIFDNRTQQRWLEGELHSS